MRVALVVPGSLDTASGGFAYDRALVDGLRAAGETVRVVSVPWRRYPLGVLDSLVARRLSPPEFDPDVVLADELAHPALLRSDTGAPVVALVHHLRCDAADGLDAAVAGTLERRFLDGCAAAVCTSRPTANSVERRAPGLRTHVAPPADTQFDPDVTAADVARRARRDPFRVAFVGNLVPRKGVLTLLDALAGLEAPWRATLVGDRPDDAYLRRVRERIRRRGLGDRTRLAGSLPTEETASVLRESHVYAMPSAHEGFGIAYLEAMGFGLPVVASASGGASDLVDPSTGVLVAPGDVGGVRDALTGFVGDRDRLATAGRGALDRYEAHPSWPETVAGVRRFLRGVVDEDDDIGGVGGFGEKDDAGRPP
ncbi:glycosyl transferase group 1 [Halogeometricum pallidum JCM 14848]|uniref:Glycosyl transferase group 1 n=1 Tax=Halogeometricum pallidum JCM 14848 TaxID=1227487 RepID=M0D8A6_HALPD|nr:glycosyltransferase family 4 protein [Halogeometricum pallidum]ELZ30922.1 glycosyl transferase group 1 [Halogeometricum pallidum JCM 14848]